MAIKAIVFDVDGTLIDSRQKIMQGIDTTLRNKGVVRTPEQLIAVMGKPIPVMYEILAPDHDVEEMVRLNFKNQEALHDTVARFDNALEVLETLRRKGLKLGVFTGYDERVHDVLREFDMHRPFESIVDCTRYVEHKPHPEGLLLCIQELGVLPQETVYIGDSITDIAAGLAARVNKTVGVAHGFTRREILQEVGAEHVVDDLLEFQTYIETLMLPKEHA